MEENLLSLLLWDDMFISEKSGEDMKGYSRSKEDYREILIKKYRTMKEAIFIEWESCSKCHMMKPHVQKRAEKSWYDFQVFRFDDASVKEFDIQAVPMLALREDGVTQEILNEEQIVNLLSNQK